jgi:microcystin-dependent protein
MGLIAKIKAAFAARRILKEAAKEKTMDGQTKPGWQTTEFWTKNIVQLVVLYNALAKKNLDPQLAINLIVALEGVYTIGRTVAKAVKDFAGQFKKKEEKPA